MVPGATVVRWRPQGSHSRRCPHPKTTIARQYTCTRSLSRFPAPAGWLGSDYESPVYKSVANVRPSRKIEVGWAEGRRCMRSGLLAQADARQLEPRVGGHRVRRHRRCAHTAPAAACPASCTYAQHTRVCWGGGSGSCARCRGVCAAPWWPPGRTQRQPPHHRARTQQRAPHLHVHVSSGHTAHQTCTLPVQPAHTSTAACVQLPTWRLPCARRHTSTSATPTPTPTLTRAR
jgi:hypothetical protein